MSRYEAGVRSDGGSFAFPIDTGLASRLEGLGLLNASSLVNSCNAGKESVLYNLIPTPIQSLDRFAVTRSTVKWVLGANGVLQEIPANTPAFEYNTDGTYRGLLVEPAGTNLLLRSEDFSASWSPVRASVATNAETSPSATLTVDKLIEDTTPSNSHYVFQGASVTNGTAYTVSVFVKASERTNVAIQFFNTNSAFATSLAYFNIGTGTITDSSQVNSATITAYPNGWYRISATETATATATGNIAIMLVSSGTTTSYTGDGTSGIFIWGAQLETGSVATSYIPTVASTQTRTADSVTLTGASSLIGQTEGTLYVEAIFANVAGSNFARVLECFTGANDRISILVNASAARGFITTAGVDTQGGTMSEAVSNNTVTKIALAYAVGASQGAFYVNGTGDITSPTAVPATASINIGQNISGALVPQWIRSVVLFPTRLTNATLATLTT